MQSELKHLEGLPAYLMMQLEARLEVRIQQAIYAEETVVDELGYCGYKWRSLWAMDSDILARHILHRLMEKRINEGRQFESILDASRKAYAQLLKQMTEHLSQSTSQKS